MRLVLLFSVFSMFPFHAFSQDIQVMLYGYSTCTKEVRQMHSFGLIKDGITYSVSDSTGILTLKEGGKYVLRYVFDDIDTTQLGRVYDLQLGKEVFRDTLSLTSIRACLEPTSHPNFIGYCCCGEKCEGEQVEYYSNGNKHIEGSFKEGIPQGELKIYYYSGQLKQVDKYNKRGYLKKRILYHQNGKVESSETY